jgi:hypothetical protein
MPAVKAVSHKVSRSSKRRNLVNLRKASRGNLKKPVNHRKANKASRRAARLSKISAAAAPAARQINRADLLRLRKRRDRGI